MSLYPDTTRFESVTIVLPVINETFSLRQSVDILLRDVPRTDICELLIVVCARTTPASMSVVDELKREHTDLVVVLNQKRPFLGGALRDAFDAARGSHVIIMSSDLETNPNEAHLLVEQSRAHPGSIITTSRWIRGGSFTGYSRIKLVCNWLFQRFFSVLYLTRLTDMTYGYRIFPTRLVQAIEWEELRHPFNLESMIKPLRLGVPALEIPSVWTARQEGESQNPFFRNFEYFRTGLKVRFAPRRSLLRRDAAG
jgi:glycosyltransferase involved in cell wall biosynthesis